MPNNRRLFIIGASHLGREMESWLDLIPEANKDWGLKGFLHTATNPSPLVGYPSDYKILGSWEDYPLTKDDYVVVAVADPGWKERIYTHLNGRVTFFTYIAPDVTIGKFSAIGEDPSSAPIASFPPT